MPNSKFRPKNAVSLLNHKVFLSPSDRVGAAIALATLGSWSALDQKGRRKGKPPFPSVKARYIGTKRARRVRLVAMAKFADRHMDQEVGADLLSQLRTHGGLGKLVEGRSASGLLRAFLEIQSELRVVVGITHYLIRCHIHPDARNKETIAAAKVFVEKWLDLEKCGSSRIEKLWEDFKLAAPYLYALSLEPTYRPQKAERPVEIFEWALTFVRSPARIERFLGHAAFAMDILEKRTSDQRVSDFVGVGRVKPFVLSFTAEERVFIESIDQKGALK